MNVFSYVLNNYIFFRVHRTVRGSDYPNCFMFNEDNFQTSVIQTRPNFLMNQGVSAVLIFFGDISGAGVPTYPRGRPLYNALLLCKHQNKWTKNLCCAKLFFLNKKLLSFLDFTDSDYWCWDISQGIVSSVLMITVVEGFILTIFPYNSRLVKLS